MSLTTLHTSFQTLPSVLITIILTYIQFEKIIPQPKYRLVHSRTHTCTHSLLCPHLYAGNIIKFDHDQSHGHWHHWRRGHWHRWRHGHWRHGHSFSRFIRLTENSVIVTGAQEVQVYSEPSFSYAQPDPATPPLSSDSWTDSQVCTNTHTQISPSTCVNTYTHTLSLSLNHLGGPAEYVYHCGGHVYRVVTDFLCGSIWTGNDVRQRPKQVFTLRNRGLYIRSPCMHTPLCLFESSPRWSRSRETIDMSTANHPPAQIRPPWLALPFPWLPTARQ